jgi:hypothetical protein
MTPRERHASLRAIVICAGFLLLLFGMAGLCDSGDRAKAQEATDDVALLAAQCCWLESEWSLPDCAAEIGVWRRNALRMRKSSGDDVLPKMAVWSVPGQAHADQGRDRALVAAVRSYERALYANNKRARQARALSWGDSDAFTERENARWLRLRLHVQRVLGGQEKNPAPSASHFGARTGIDHELAERAIKAGRWRRIEVKGMLQDYYATVRQ